MVHRYPLYVGYQKLSAGFLPAGDRGAGKSAGSGIGSDFGGGYVGADHQGGPGVYRGAAHSAGLSVPAEIFCYRACDGSGEGVTQPESIALDTPERGMGLMIKYLIGGEKE